MKKSAVLIVILVVNGIMSNVFSQTKTSLKNLLNNVVEDAVNSVTNKITTLTPEDIASTWKYSAPACEFESGEVLKDAGGKLIAAEVESQLTDIYSKAGITASTFGYSFADSTFTNQYKKINLKGVYSLNGTDKQIDMTYQVAGLIRLGESSAKIEKNGDKLVLLFDAQKLVKILSTLSAKTSSTTLKTVNSILSSYKNVLIGYELTRQ